VRSVHVWSINGSSLFTEIVKFRDMLEERIKNSEPSLASFPDEHKPLIAKLAHERSVLWRSEVA
jgi:hypothetical protein